MTGRAAILTWDYRQQPDWERLAQLVRDLSGGTVHLHHVEDTGSQDYALVVSTAALGDEQATDLYHRWDEKPTDDVFDLDEGATRG